MQNQKRNQPHSPRSIRPAATPSAWAVFVQQRRIYPRMPLMLPPLPDADRDAVASYVLAMAPIMAEIMWLMRDWDPLPWTLEELREQWTRKHGYWPATAVNRGLHALHFCGLLPSTTWYAAIGISRSALVTLPRGCQFQWLIEATLISSGVEAGPGRPETWCWDLLGLEEHWLIEAFLWTALRSVNPTGHVDCTFNTACHPLLSSENLARARRALRATKPSADPIDALYRAVGRVLGRSA